MCSLRRFWLLSKDQLAAINKEVKCVYCISSNQYIIWPLYRASNEDRVSPILGSCANPPPSTWTVCIESFRGKDFSPHDTGGSHQTSSNSFPLLSLQSTAHRSVESRQGFPTKTTQKNLETKNPKKSSLSYLKSLHQTLNLVLVQLGHNGPIQNCHWNVMNLINMRRVNGWVHGWFFFLKKETITLGEAWHHWLRVLASKVCKTNQCLNYQNCVCVCECHLTSSASSSSMITVLYEKCT